MTVASVERISQPSASTGATAPGLAEPLPSDASPAVEIVSLTKRFADFTAVDDLSLAIRRGEFLTLLGPSGCGKSTLLNLIAGFFDPTSGIVRIDGEDVTRLPPYRRSTGLVFQNYALFPHMSVYDNIAFGLKMRRLKRDEIARRIAEIVEIVRLPGHEHKRVHELSGGQQQRVALARALVIRPKILLLDEPLSALDKDLRGQMQVELKQIQTKLGVTTVFVTHDQGEALSLSDRIAVMKSGRIEQLATPSELYRRPTNRFIASFIGQVNTIGGMVAATANGLALGLAGGELLEGIDIHGGSISPGQKAELAVRPEDIQFVPLDAPGPNLLVGNVEHLLYQGSHTVVFVRTASLGTILVLDRGDVIDRFALGDEVRLRIDVRKSVLVGA